MSILALLQAAEYLEQAEQQPGQSASYSYQTSDLASSVCSFDGEFSTCKIPMLVRQLSSFPRAVTCESASRGRTSLFFATRSYDSWRCQLGRSVNHEILRFISVFPNGGRLGRKLVVRRPLRDGQSRMESRANQGR